MRILTVSQALSYLRELIESDLVLGDVWVAGEVSGPRTQPSGHTYFTLKDESAQLRSVLFRSALLRQRRLADYLTQGSQVIVHGRLTVYEARGELQVVVDFVQPEGVGLRQAQFERLRLQLEEEGLFDAARKRPLPPFPQRVGVVTSPAGAVLHDICNVLRRRWPLAEVVLAPTPVQGPEAPLGIAGAIEMLNRLGDIDVIIVARGGGSLEDLWCFNDEQVARAIFGSVIPIVSGVGHETDTTIADYVADVRAPTPSAAAELVAPERTEVSVRLSVAAGTLLANVQDQLESGRSGVRNAALLMERAAPDINRERQRTDDLTRQTMTSVETMVRTFQKGLHGFHLALRSLDPYATLQRGYALVQRDGHVVDSVEGATVGERLNVRVRDGDFPVRVDSGGAVPDQKRRKRTAVAKEQAPLFLMEV